MNASTPDRDRLRAALDLLERLEPGASTRVRANLDEFDPDAARTVLGFAFADVVSRPALDLRTREMLTVAALTAMGTASGQLEFHVPTSSGRPRSRIVARRASSDTNVRSTGLPVTSETIAHRSPRSSASVAVSGGVGPSNRPSSAKITAAASAREEFERMIGVDERAERANELGAEFSGTPR